MEINARMWGWVHRRRGFWLAGPDDNIDTIRPVLPQGFALVKKEKDPSPRTIVALDVKMCPSTVLFAQGFVQKFSPQVAVTDYAIAVFSTFTREFHHPADSMKRATPAAADRFKKDHRRFPAMSYEEGSLLWRGTEWRQPDPAERAILHGLPPAMVESIQAAGGPEQATAARNSAVGNGFHAPSLMLALILLFQMMPQAQALPRSLPEPREQGLQERIRNTAFDNYLVDRFPGVLSARDLVRDMQEQLPMIRGNWDKVETILHRGNLRRLQRFWIFLRLQGHTATEAGPEWAMQRQRALAQAALGSQRSAGDSKKGLDHMLTPGLGKERHIVEATKANNPFEVKQPMDLDLAYAAEALATFWARRCSVEGR